jgi:cytosine/adenosine deaminase-related metal-dependent hydrolase
MRNISTLFIHATVITVDDDRRIWLDGAVLVTLNRIVAIDRTASLLRNPDLPSETRIVDCTGRIIQPGMVNTHAHLAQSLLRGLAEDVPLQSWLCDSIWPLEANYEGDDGYVAARLTIAEMLRSGTTCFLEAMLTYRSGFDNVARAVDEMGIRGCLVGNPKHCFPRTHLTIHVQGKLVKVEETNARLGITDPRDRDVSSMSIASALVAHENYHGSSGGRLQVWMAASTPRGSSESAHLAIGDACAQHGIGLTMHCAEAPKDLSIYRESYGCTPVEFCARTHLIGKGRNTVLAHMVNLDLDKDLPLLREAGASVAHNPSSNCKLASGIAPVPDMMTSEVNVCLGTDGAPCSNTYDMLQEMRLAALVHKGTRRDAAVMDAEEVLAMATINGAKALGLDKEIGSLEVGKKADFVVLDVSGLHCTPFDQDQVSDGGLDPVTTVVYSCSGSDVEMVVIDGQVVVEDRKLICADERQIKEAARGTIRRLRDQAGVRSKLKRNIC